MSALPVPRIVSAAGFVTSLGGGSPSETVRAAMDEAAASTRRPDDLQAWASEAIAAATGAEAGWVTLGRGELVVAPEAIAPRHRAQAEAALAAIARTELEPLPTGGPPR